MGVHSGRREVEEESTKDTIELKKRVQGIQKCDGKKNEALDFHSFNDVIFLHFLSRGKLFDNQSIVCAFCRK